MSGRPLETLPEPLLDELLSTVLRLVPSLRIAFLSSFGSCIHASAVRVLFRTLTIEDDARIFSCTKGPTPNAGAMYPLLTSPARYAPVVRGLIICDPDVAQAFATPSNPEIPEDLQSFRPIDTNMLALVFETCENIEELVWESSLSLPDGLCEILASRTPRLTRFSCMPRQHRSSVTPRSALTKWDAPSLPLLSPLSITSLHLSRLSQAGARAFSSLLAALAEESSSSLEDLSIDFVWLDDPLCEKIAQSGRKIRRLSLGTSGTKLSDKGITALVEGCDALEELVLDEVQGRLSRVLWTKPLSFPMSLRHLRVVIAETGPHHSWTTDHLNSISAVPLHALSSLSIERREALPSLNNGSPTYEVVVDDVVAIKPVPREFIEKMKQTKSNLTALQCDFWGYSISDVKVLLESCPKLETLKLCLDAPFAKLFGLTSTFASLSNLRTLFVSVNHVHAPGKPPVPLLPFSTNSLPTPTDSPVSKAKSVLPQLLDLDQMQTQTSISDLGDSTMPLLRDIKRFVRKCPRLELLQWYGKAGRGSWNITRPATASKISSNVSVEYCPPKITEEIWKEMSRAKAVAEATGSGWPSRDVERIGQAWTGDVAEALAAERQSEKDKGENAPLTERAGRAKESGKKARISSISTSSSSSSDVLVSTPTTVFMSPTKVFSPLTSPNSETFISDYARNTELVWPEIPDPQASRKRSPSEPGVRTHGACRARARSATTTTKDKEVEQRPFEGKKASSGSNNGRARSGRGRGASSNRGARKSATPGDAPLPAVGSGPSWRARDGGGPKLPMAGPEPGRGKRSQQAQVV